jgi:transposase-like protein
MRIEVRLPKVKPGEYEVPEECAYAGCAGRHFKRHGREGERKPLRDVRYEEARSYRWKCLRCGRTFRVYPPGVSQAQQSDRLKAISVLLYVLGLSYGGTADFLTALGCGIGKTTVYRNVQAAGEVARRRQRVTVARGGKRPVVGTDGTYVKVKGEQVGVQVVVDDESGELVGLDIVVSENEEEVLEIIREVVEEVDADVIVSDDLDVYKHVTDKLGLGHQICRSHVKRNVDELANSIEQQAETGSSVPEGVISSGERLEEDLAQVCQLVRERPADGARQLARMYHRYKGAPAAKKGQRQSPWYRTRMLITRLWDRWPRLTLDQHRDDLDGTNNASERLIGWHIKERYRTMRGYKRTESIRNVVTLTARMGVRSGHYDMTELYN